MTALAIRKKLISFISNADDKKVKSLYSLLGEDLISNKNFNLSEEHLEILNTRRARHLSGKDRSLVWDEVVAKIRNTRKKKY